MKQKDKFHHPDSWHEARLHHGIRRYCVSERGSTMAARAALSSRQRIRRDPRETVPRWHARLHHGSRKMPIIAADSILQGEGETISRRHERGCVLSGRGRAYHGVTRDSLCLMEAGEPINGGTSDSISIMPRGQTVSRWQEGLHVQRGNRPSCWLVPCATARESPLLS